LQASRDGVVVEEGDLIAYVNEAAARMHGCASPAEMIGQLAASFLMPEDSARMREYGQKRLRGEPAPTVYPFRGRRKDGLPIELEASVSTCQVGGKGYVITVVRDVAERAALEAQLWQAQKMDAIGRLAGGIAHDFNNLLTVINGYSEMLVVSAGQEESALRMLVEINRAGERAAALTRQLLAFSRKQVLQLRVVDLNAVVTGVVAMLGRLIGEDVDLVVQLDPTLGAVRADPNQLEQVIVNLAINARDAMLDGGRLTILTRNTDTGPVVGPHVLLEVADTGCGMSEEVKQHLFEPFFTTKGVGQGTGLGLAVVHGIVQQSGGRVEAQSQPGQGSTFRVYLPRVLAAILAETVPVVPPPVGGTETVLLVEDEEGVRVLARQALQQCGYRVLEARDGREALEIAADYPGQLNLLVSDVVMPHLNGPQLARRLLLGRPGLRVLLISGYTADLLARQGAMDGRLALLEKPFTPAELARKVRELLDRW
jgi:PAS domain S-box-containing protein